LPREGTCMEGTLAHHADWLTVSMKVQLSIAHV